MPNSYQHIFVTGNASAEKYKVSPSQGRKPRIPDRDRAVHSAKLLAQFDAIWQAKEQINQQREAEQVSTRQGTYLTFTSAADHDLITKSLEDIRTGVRLLNIKEDPVGENQIQVRATVYIPNGQEGSFIRKISSYSTKNNTTIFFPNQLDHTVVTETINQLGNAIILKKATDITSNDEVHTKASIFLPVGQENYFIGEIQRLFPGTKIRITPSNADLVNSIEDVSTALLEGLWTDSIQLIPDEHTKWCEVWLRVDTRGHNEAEQIAVFLTILESIGIQYKQNTIIFPERAVLLINANRAQLIELMLRSDLLAELRSSQEPAGFWVNESTIEQQGWVEDLLGRLAIVESPVRVCVLDTGVNNGHQLLQPLMDDDNTLTVEASWGLNDHYSGSGHGTLMSGIAGYGNLEAMLTSGSPISITHLLCSVKILPPPTQQGTPKELWGDITAQGIARAEIQNPDTNLIYCMAVTSTQDADRGRPSSWSGAVDNLAYGEGDNQRLIIISAGNIDDEVAWKNYPASNFTTTIENPAQAWNALVVGAHTEKFQVNNPAYGNHKPVANQGELSPYSSTSLMWEKKWPIKPDVVFEGGNLLTAPNSSIVPHEDLELLSTSKTFNTKPFDTINATSAATAKASWFAAKIAYQYPNAWPETIRGLIVHSAEWNTSMMQQMSVRPRNRGDYKNLLRVFGFGVPQLERALYSEENALTFIVQETIQPFGFNNRNQPETNEIHFFNFPWPKDLLLGMGEVPVRLRITLSYYVEPGAGEIGWKDKYRYQSHGLRFDINNVGENDDDFRKRVNIAAREENEEVNTNSGSDRWAIGTNNRTSGSIHGDFWEGTAADLASCNLIAVFPIIGWWRERKHLGKVDTQARYSLIISIDTPAQDVELYTTVRNMIEIPVEIPAG